MNVDQANNLPDSNNINWQRVRSCVNTSSLDNRGVIGKIWNNVSLTIFRSCYWLFTKNGYLNNKNIELLVSNYKYNEKEIENNEQLIYEMVNEVSHCINQEKVAQWLDHEVAKLNGQQKKVIKKFLKLITTHDKYNRKIDISRYDYDDLCLSEKEKNILGEIDDLWEPISNQINMLYAVIADDFYGAKWVEGDIIYNGWLHQKDKEKPDNEIAYELDYWSEKTVIFHKGLIPDITLTSEKYPEAAKHFNSVLKNDIQLDKEQSKNFIHLMGQLLIEKTSDKNNPLRKALVESYDSYILYDDPNEYFGSGKDGNGKNKVGKGLKQLRKAIMNSKEDDIDEINLDHFLEEYSNSFTDPSKNFSLQIDKDDLGNEGELTEDASKDSQINWVNNRENCWIETDDEYSSEYYNEKSQVYYQYVDDRFYFIDDNDKKISCDVNGDAIVDNSNSSSDEEDSEFDF